MRTGPVRYALRCGRAEKLQDSHFETFVFQNAKKRGVLQLFKGRGWRGGAGPFFNSALPLHTMAPVMTILLPLHRASKKPDS